MFDKKKDII